MISRTFAALAEPNRLQIVEVLLAGPKPVGDICAAVGLGQPQVSKHLRVLREAGLVQARPQAQQRLYALHPEPLREFHDWLDRFRAIWDRRFDQMDELLQKFQARETDR